MVMTTKAWRLQRAVGADTVPRATPLLVRVLRHTRAKDNPSLLGRSLRTHLRSCDEMLPGEGDRLLEVTWEPSLGNLANLCENFSRQVRLILGLCASPRTYEWHEDARNLLWFRQPNILSF